MLMNPNKIKSIKEGDSFLCIKTVIMDTGEEAYTKGKYYISEIDGCITDNEGCRGHSWIANYEKYFVPVDDVVQPCNNNVEHPSHYTQGGIECIDAMESAFGKEAVKDICICNAFKYIWRFKSKNGTEDIDKAVWYLNKYRQYENL